MKRERVSEHLLIAANQNRKEKEYWFTRLAGLPEKAVFHYDYHSTRFKEQPAANSDTQSNERQALPEMGEYRFELTNDAFLAATKLSNQSDARLHMIFSAAVTALLFRFQCGEDIITGTPIYRQDVDTSFINTMLVLRHEVNGDMSYKDLLLQARNVIKEAVEHQNYPLEILAEQLAMPFTLHENPFFDVVVMLENIQAESYIGSIPYAVLFAFSRENSAIRIRVKYRKDRYKENTIRLISDSFCRLFAAMAADVNAPIRDHNLITDADRQRLLTTFNGKTISVPDDLPFHVLFQQQVKHTPDRVAVIGAGYLGLDTHSTEQRTVSKKYDVMLSYRQLNHSADILAALLRARGVGPDSIVAIMLDRCVEMITAVLGVLKAGGAYLPIDPDYPVERISYMLKDSAIEWLLTVNHLESVLTGIGGESDCNVLYLDQMQTDASVNDLQTLSEPCPSGENLAYVIYTSGSTGKPKGVMVPHNCFVNAAIAWQQDYRLQEIEVNLLQMASFSFDVFAGDLARALINGGKLVINSEAVMAPDIFHRLIDKHRITLLESTPSYVVPFMDYVYENNAEVPSLQLLILGSDSCPASDFNRLRQRYGKRMRIINSYGVTEATIDSSYYEEPDLTVQLESNVVPIGKPMPNMQFYILDRNAGLLPIGVPGELYIGGRGVTRGYLNNPELTADRFPALPIASGQPRLYRTGDLGRWLAGGNMEFLGRVDFQVKIRGFRIELGEIESRLLEHPDIKEAVVVMKGEQAQERYLCGYVASDKVFDPAGLREYLGNSLPEHMVPWFFITLEKLPLTPNGKIDRKALPDPDTQDTRPYIPPSTDTEHTLVDIWSIVLKQEKSEIGVDTEFFDLGGNSLMAIVVTSKIHKAFDIRMQLTDIFKLQTIRAIGRFLDGTGRGEGFESIPIAPVQEYYPLSSAQKRLYFLQRMDPGSTVYSMPNMVRLAVDLEIGTVNLAFSKLVKRHESLRTSFHTVNGEPVQKIHDGHELKTGAHYFTPQSEEETAQIIGTFIRPFDLGKAPLVRIGIIQLKGGGYIFMADLHHIVSDGVSQNILVRDFISLYQDNPLPVLRIHYKDYTLWLLNQDYANQDKFWLEQFNVPAPVLELPNDFPRPTVRSFRGKALRFRMDNHLTAKLKTLISESGATLYMVLLSGLNILLSRYSGSEDIVIGSVTAGRRHADLDKVIGMFVNTLALRHFPSAGLSYREFLEQVKERSLKAFENQDYPFESLIEALSVNRDTSRNPLFDVMLVLDTYDSRSKMEGEAVSQDWGHRVSKFDVTFLCVDYGEELAFMVEYCTALFSEATIKRMFNHYFKVLETVVSNQEIYLADINLAGEEENRQLMEWANGPVREIPDLTLQALFENQVHRTPHHMALYSSAHPSNKTHRRDKSYLSYTELNLRAQYAAQTLKEQGIGPGSIAAIKMKPCLEMIIAVFAILKTGAAYLPIDPEYPQERIEYMLTDSNAATIIDAPVAVSGNQRIPYSSPLERGGPRSGGVCLDGTDSNKACYIIYTSGTTGRPKGVLVGHRGVVNTLTCRKEFYGFDETWIMLQLFSFAFDGFITSMFTPLISGAQVVLPASDESKDIKILSAMIARHGVNHLISVPQLYREIIMRLSPEHASSLRKVTLAGDVVTGDLPVLSSQKHPDLEFYLEYGITEASVMSTLHRHRDGQVIKIGKPAWNTQVHILDKKGRCQPAGVAGELCIGGMGLAMGYLNRVELSAKKFRDGLYYSGDLGCWTSEGDIRFLGRLDQQVKIRGFRIETGEIEVRLSEHDRVDSAIVLAIPGEDGQQRLAAYLVLNGEQAITSLEFRSYLSGSLPHYMIPSYFTVLQSMPLTANGKIDRRALSSIRPELSIMEKSRQNYIEPVTGMEKRVARLWSEVLRVEKVGSHDNFFDLGGNSFDIIKVSDLLEKEIDKDIPVVKLFKYPTVSTLAHFLSHGEASAFNEKELQLISEDKARGKNRLKERSRRKRTK